ncbi:hypothetical protein PAXRUDRAFT_832413 [Paxillus rubicundulus Ve08.2h10]|uniref:Uncharacterized protein n=1 Tax=Paxillus rubicundulus Ve08.2h10 TaxID=930991 RepID=A0A0D0DK81_9AGAM|nr:hypothetical protein PAXRUDRAFT_832413 [Paxillus rubicundulus Ve08.2h10]
MARVSFQVHSVRNTASRLLYHALSLGLITGDTAGEPGTKTRSHYPRGLLGHGQGSTRT